MNFYQSLPSRIYPEIFQIGFLSIRWYSIGYILALATILFLAWRRIKKEKFDFQEKKPAKVKEIILDFVIVSFFGTMIGARLGYFIFYDWQTIFQQPLEIFIPNQAGFFGFSFHGGLIGGLISAFVFSKKKKTPWKNLENFFIPIIPLAFFWGRLGNFFNGELWGKPTEKFWGMYPDNQNPSLSHPSQLYEALGEGLVIFIILWSIKNKPWAKNNLLSLFLILYGSIRFGIEFFRISPPEHIILGFLTTGQVLCLGMIAFGIYLFQKNNQ
jgi:phosphatidylglycerol:prolipoprotein diacylglycerol transferase